MPTQLNIVVIQNNSGTVTTSTVNVAISAGLQAIDSGASSAQGVASGQTGTSSIDLSIRNIFKAGVFLATNGTWYPTSVIQSIGWQ
jgi:hypothetical protein